VNRRTNTLVFILLATVSNLALTLLSFFVFYLLYALLLAPRLPQDSVTWCLALIFLAALTVSFLVYHALLKRFMRKVDVRKHFAPLFKPRGK
jgi:hypothetical protein